MKPVFPILQIELLDWELELIAELIRFDSIYYSNDFKFYDTYIANKQFLDSEGRIFVANEMLEKQDFLSKIGIRKRNQILFEYTNADWKFDDAKRFIVSRVSTLSDADIKNDWVEALNEAETIKQLIEAQR